MNSQAGLEQLIDKLLSKNVLGQFSPNTGMIVVRRNPAGLRVPYNLSEHDFFRNFNTICDLMTWFHEVTHFIQYRSTTFGIFETFFRGQQIDTFLDILEKTSFHLPFQDHFDNLAKAPSINFENIMHNPFCSYFLHLLHVNRLSQWITGTLPKENIIDDSVTSIFSDRRGDLFTSQVHTYPLGFKGIKPIGVKKYPFVFWQPTDKSQKSMFYTGFGMGHLIEFFAKSIEIEHLLAFNKEIGQSLFLRWLNDDNSLLYNTTFRITHILGEQVWKSILPKISNFTLAHLRIFVDIALMYSDFLWMKEDITQGDDKQYALRFSKTKIQPGITFIEVLRAFTKCAPLKDYGDDSLRLYNDLCDLLGYPTHEEMVTMLLEIVEAMLDGPFYAVGTAHRPLAEISKDLLIEKKRNPNLLINQLINPIQFNHAQSIIYDRVPIICDKYIQDPFNEPILINDAVYRVYKDAIEKSELKCPLTDVYNICINDRSTHNSCKGNNTGIHFDVTCPIGHLIKLCLSGGERGKDGS